MTQSIVAAMSDSIKQSGGELSRSKEDKITYPVLLIAGEHDIFAPCPRLRTRRADARQRCWWQKARSTLCIWIAPSG